MRRGAARLHGCAVGDGLVGVDGLAELLAVEEVLGAGGGGVWGWRSVWLERALGVGWVAGAPFPLLPSVPACFAAHALAPNPRGGLACSSCWTLGMRVEPPTSTTSSTPAWEGWMAQARLAADPCSTQQWFNDTLDTPPMLSAPPAPFACFRGHGAATLDPGSKTLGPFSPGAAPCRSCCP